jgi:hypothetical protein
VQVIDLRNAFELGRNADNFTVLLLRLIAKADSNNRMLLRNGFPVEVKAVEIFQMNCPYRNEPGRNREVDWDRIVNAAEMFE